MNDPLIIGFLSLGVMIGMAVIGVPIAVAAGIVGMGGLMIDLGISGAFGIIGTLPYSVLANFGISLIPLFFLMGDFAAQAGIAKDAFDAAYKLFGKVRGGLAMATTVGSALSAATMGSSLANAALFTRIALPPMMTYNYSRSFALGCIAAVGTFAIMIPPSITFVLYGIVTQQSIGALLLAGIFPGIFTAVVYLSYIFIRCRSNPELAPISEVTFSIREKLRGLVQLWAIFFLFFLVMGGIYAGYFTPSAGGAVGAFGAFILAIFKRRLSWKIIGKVSIETVQGTTAIMIILVGAFLLGRHLILCGFTEELVQICSGGGVIPGWVVMLLFSAMYLLLGCVMETVSMLVTTMPFVYPVVTALGYDGIWFGVIFVKLAELGMLTPPLGANLFVVSATAGEDTSVMDVVKGVGPFLLLEIPILVILIAYPQLSIYLPSKMYGQ
ncbi:MAG TPA: TRAP transporter large permease [Deltaproteobacteria bacterium]|nr:TRAP transporter large permease [Deltaproteobacteria bacterium]